MARSRYRYLVVAVVAPLALMGLKCRPAQPVEWTGTVTITRTANGVRLSDFPFVGINVTANGSQIGVYKQWRDQSEKSIWSNLAASYDMTATVNLPVTGCFFGGGTIHAIRYQYNDAAHDGGFDVTESSDHLEVTAQPAGNATTVVGTIDYQGCPDQPSLQNYGVMAADFTIPGTDGGQGVVDLCLQPNPPTWWWCGLAGATVTATYDLHRTTTP